MVRIEKTGAVWTIIHSRFEAARNAMDPESADALVAAFKAFDSDPSASVAVLWGEGGAFCAGWDLKYASTLSDREAFQKDMVEGLAFPTGANPAPRGPLGPTRLELSKPVIGAVEGPAVAGGMELALWCDIRVMAESAYFGVYCRRWGIPLLDGGSVRLTRLVGQGRAMEIILTGARCQLRRLFASACVNSWWRTAARGRRPRRWPTISPAFPRRRCGQTAVQCWKPMAWACVKLCAANGPMVSRRTTRKVLTALPALPAAWAAMVILRKFKAGTT